ncbi:hypothetical protein O181_094413 [Austropuccinia psidii MF-1]|uniref:Uncharacterized protein n=1 Tax=Austropuccinia psidii MF-1 TaxID=1389203 RepID=A0A9Q3J344_9BASI|nr:hypothetical protein [Austropuccinia psidii MF-1]
MPKPQRTDSCGTEGEYSVSSVSFELMTKDYAFRRTQGFRLCTSSLKKNQGCWDITQFMAPSGSSMWGSKALLGPNYQSRTSPSAPGKVLDPDHVGENWQKATFWSLGPPGSPANLGPGGLQWPPQTTDYGLRTMAHGV